MSWQDDLFGPTQPIDAVDPAQAAPWSWVPQDWNDPGPPPVDPFAAAPPPPVEAPVEPLTPPLGTPDPALVASAPAPDPMAAAMQPGLPVPASTFEGAMAGSEQSDLENLAEAQPDYMSPAGHVTEAPPDVAGMAAQYAAASPQERAVLDKRAELDKQDFAEAQQRAALMDKIKQDEADFDADRKARAAARADVEKVNAEAMALANEKVDGGRWWGSRSTPQKIAGFLAAIVGGLVQGRKGGPNEGLAMIEREIDRDIEVQKANLSHRKGVLDTRRGIANDKVDYVEDEARATAIHRAASWEHVKQTLLAEQMNYDPAGTRARELGKAYVDATGKQAAAMRAFEEKNFERKKDLIKIDQEQQKIDESVRSARVKEQRAAAGAYASAAKARAENEKHDPSYYAQQGLAAPPIKMSEKEYTTWTGRKEKQYEMGKEERAAAAKQAEIAQERGISGQLEPVKDEAGNTVDVINKPLTQKDGSQWIPQGSTTAVDKLRDQKKAADRLTEIYDEIDTIGPEWLSDTANADKGQRLKVLQNEVKLIGKNLHELGVITGSDEQYLNGVAGFKDLTGYKSTKAGRVQGRKTVVDGINVKMRDHGFTGKYDPQPIGDAPKPMLTEEEQAVKDLATSRAGQDDSKSGDHGHSAGNLAEGIVEFGTRLSGNSAAVTNRRAAESSIDTAKAQKTIGQIGERARSGHKATRDQALADLLNLTKTAQSPGVREMAATELRRIADPSATYEIEEPLSIGPSSSTVRDTSSVGKGK